MDAALILALTLAVLGVMVVVLIAIAAVVLAPAVRRALADRPTGADAALAEEAGSGPSGSPEGAEDGDGGGR